MQHQERADTVANEEAAWLGAIKLAAKHRLPLLSTIRRQALYSYRYCRLLDSRDGSNRQNKPYKRTNIDRTKGSLNTSKAKQDMQMRPMGKKGKRKYKKETKRRTARYERRNRRVNEH